VCTHDRSNELARCLFALMALPDDGQEYLVVDNRPSNDAAAQVAATYPRVRYIRQLDGGLNAARNRALREARHDLVAFTDDDAYVDRGWLRAITRNFHDPLVACATGLTLPAELETEAQECFERYAPFGRGYARRVFESAAMNPVAVGPVGAGANMALRRSILDSVGEFDEALDGGTPTRSGGDHEMFSRILSAGFRIVYDPAAVSWHRHRRTRHELVETVRGYGTGVYAMWTRALLVGGELGVFKQAIAWLRHRQIPEFGRSLHPRRRRVPLAVLLAELRGCLAGPAAYFASRRALRRRAPAAGAWNEKKAPWPDAQVLRRT
jgi:GT2 family glycosyltransferase